MVVNVPTKVIPVWFVEKWAKEESADGSPLRFFIEQMIEAWDKEQRVTILHEKRIKEES